MSVSVYMKGDYEELTAIWARKNKANLLVLRTAWCVLRKRSWKNKANQSQFISYCVLRDAYCVSVLSFLWKQESSYVNGYGFRIKCGMTGLVGNDWIW